MAKIPQQLLDEILQKSDIVDIVSGYVHLRKSGRNYVGLCPFHSEKTPSFSVSPEKQIFYCFGCGVGGGAFQFLMNIDQLTFPEAVKVLAERVNVHIPEVEKQEDDSPIAREKEQLLQAHELAAKWFHHVLYHAEEGKLALSYLESRQFNTETIEQFRIGYAPSSWDGLTKLFQNRGFSLPLLERGGLISKSDATNRYFDRFRNRIMFPILDAQGRVIAFGGRVMDQSQPKYLNSPETLLFNKSRTLYNLSFARQEIRKKQQVILFEGYVDVIAVFQRGVHNVVATLGTSLTEEHARIMRRNAEQVVLCFDSDNAGLEAANRGIEILKKADCVVKVALLPNGNDPDDYIRSHGKEKFLSEIIESAVPVTVFRLMQARKEFDLTDETERMKFIQQALAVISELPHAVEREHYLRELSIEFNLSMESLKADQKQVYYKQKKSSARDIPGKAWNNSINIGNSQAENALLPAFHNAERRCLALMLKFPEIVTKVYDEVGSEFYVDEYAAIAAYIYGYFAENDSLDLNSFIQTIQDPKLVESVIALAMMELPDEVNEKELLDLFKQIRDYPTRQRIKSINEEIKKAERTGDAVSAAHLAMERLMLEQTLKIRNRNNPVEGGK